MTLIDCTVYMGHRASSSILILWVTALPHVDMEVKPQHTLNTNCIYSGRFEASSCKIYGACIEVKLPIASTQSQYHVWHV